MEALTDLSWIMQTANGTLERFDLLGYSVTALGVRGEGPHRDGTYRFRMLFFPHGALKPVYALNLETSILGDWLLTEQEGGQHHIVTHLERELSYEEFRMRALERAISILEKKEEKD